MPRRIVIASPKSGRDLDDLALKIVKSFQPELLMELRAFDIERFFECELETITGVKIDYRTLPTGIHGYTDSGTMESVISAELMEDETQLFFTRSTMSHETAHALIHVPEFRRKKAILTSVHNAEHGIALRMHRESDVRIYQNPEWQAWRFAGALLMPRPALEEAIRRGNGLRDLSRLFNVNPAFIETRLRALKITL
ncbi:MAG: hypothetical protein A2W25_06005 [candidate division Zixibacteria bacterium RBG_16_53_22]|nr:MAG: hypothetical protein A2W25_06005 [candidate division Zixibacteria bacterium RBG_16_53_22]